MFAQATFMSVALYWLFIAISIGECLALQKLKDLFSFTNSFITYDLLAMRNFVTLTF